MTGTIDLLHPHLLASFMLRMLVILGFALVLLPTTMARTVEHADYALNADYDNNRFVSTGLFNTLQIGGASFQPIAGDVRANAWASDVKAGNDVTIEMCQVANGVCIARSWGCGYAILTLADTTHAVNVLVHTRAVNVGCPIQLTVPLGGTINMLFT